MKHKHADAMLEYAKDAQTTKEPWLLWEYCRDYTWYDLNSNPQWAEDIQYRRIVSKKDMEVVIKRLLASQPMQVKQADQAELFKVLSKQEAFYEDYGQFCGGYQTLKFRVWDITYTVELDPEGTLLNITYTKKDKHVQPI
jgi:hypothetical protein